MPSELHDTINLIFRENPHLAVELLHDHLGVDLPADLPVQIAPGDLNDRPSRDMHPDTVFTLGPRREPRHAIALEIQQEFTPEKRLALPRYAAALWLRLDCPVTVLVFCPDRKTAAAFREPIPTTLPGYIYTPTVMGPDETPVITDPGDAAARLALATLSVRAHGEQRSVTEAFVNAINNLPDGHAEQYYEYAHAIAPRSIKHLLEEMMATSSTWVVSSPFAKEHYGRGLEQGRAEGEAKGKVEGKIEGKIEGKAEGEVEGEAKAVLTFLEARGIVVPDHVRGRIHRCTDPDLLLAWARKAATVTRAEDIFGD
ncbi:hypothetical protein AB0K60_13095 [Thermopolyspora sp. NPDC052614]|uniref:hypothetical protein n=1 Tax=Thermopolyspora sp. NPDC052614 TaxID=3155682 RepID=UPI003437F6ED